MNAPTEKDIMRKTIAPTHPGDVLNENILKPLDRSANALAIAIRVPATRINEIIRRRRSVTADTALLLSRYFGTKPELLATPTGPVRSRDRR